MLEYPEVKVIAAQMKKEITNLKVVKVLPPSKPHKFCWYNGEPSEYDTKIKDAQIIDVLGLGIFVELYFSNGYKLHFNDGVNARLVDVDLIPSAYQLVMILSNNKALVFTVAMYGGIILYDGEDDNDYYQKSLHCYDLLDKDFDEYFNKIFSNEKETLSLKAFLATEQRFVGLGNGVLQDILFLAKLNPRRKIGSLTNEEKQRLIQTIPVVLKEMINKGGRDTEKDLYGNCGQYLTKMSSKNYTNPCPICGSKIIKEAYLGGSVYYCPNCQKLPVKK